MDEQKVKALFQNIRMLIELEANFTNGIQAQGGDEGDIKGWAMWSDYIQEAYNLGVIELYEYEKPRYGITENKDNA